MRRKPQEPVFRIYYDLDLKRQADTNRRRMKLTLLLLALGLIVWFIAACQAFVI